MPFVATETLLAKRSELVIERDRMLESYNQQIASIESAIETIEGKKVWETPPTERYDDESPDYIKGSFEG